MVEGICGLNVSYSGSLQGIGPFFFQKYGIVPMRQDQGMAPCPLLPEEQIWASIHSRTFGMMSFEDSLGTSVAGRMLAKVIAREIDFKELSATDLCAVLHNSVRGNTDVCYLVGGARAFNPSSVAQAFEQVTRPNECTILFI